MIHKESSITFEKHYYDVDIIEAANTLISLIGNNDFVIKNTTPEKYIEMLWYMIETYCEYQKIDYEYLRQNQIIVPSEHNFYPVALAVKLMSTPIHRIHRLLEEQEKKFTGNYYAKPDNFVGLIEYFVCLFIESNSPIDNSSRLYEIMKWIRENRKESLEFNIDQHIKKIISKKLNQKTINALLHGLIQAEKSESKRPDIKIAIIDINGFLDKFYNGFKNFFDEKEHKQLYKLLEGKSIRTKLSFCGRGNVLIELFKRVKYHKKINASNENLAYWIFRNFKYHNEKLKQYVDFNIDYISEVMRKIDKEPNYDELILTDLLKYKSKDDRKNYLV